MAETSRTRQLRKLAQNLPNANQDVAKGMQSARQAQLQETIKAAKPTAGPQAAQAIGAQQQAQAGQISLQQQQQQQAQAQQVGQVGLQAKRREAQADISQQQRGLQTRQRKYEDTLYKLGKDAKNTLLDEQLEFKKDEAGRLLLNQRQAMDWALTKAQSEEEYANYAQAAKQMTQRKIQILEHQYNKLQQALEQGYISDKQKLDQESQLELEQLAAETRKRLAREQAKAANEDAAWEAGGQIFGTMFGAGPKGGGAISKIVRGFGG